MSFTKNLSKDFLRGLRLPYVVNGKKYSHGIFYRTIKNKRKYAVIDTHKPKYFKLYMDLAVRCSRESVAERIKVGSVLVTNDGMISIGWNGTPSGMDNCCEFPPEEVINHRTRPEVIHAERNAIDKVCREGVKIKGSLLFITLAPCVECAKSIHAMGIAKVFYLSEHEDKTAGTELLHTLKVPCELFNEEGITDGEV